LPIASAPARSARVGTAFAWEVAKRTTERDREIAWLLYRQKILTTDQLRLLFFSSLRRCQDRLLWLHRHRVIDRFFPAGPFSLGKPQAHWLLDEVGAHLVAARVGRERKSLAWNRQQDFHEHAHLAHRLECNAFVCNVIAASLDTEDVWVGDWGLGWEAIKQPWPSFGGYEATKPDAGFSLNTPYGLVVIALEWDRATEPMTTLLAKIRRYGTTLQESRALRRTNVCFVVPGERRAERLRREGEEAAKQVPEARFWATTTAQLEDHGPLGEIWRCLDHEERPYGMAEFEIVDGAEITPREHALGRRWQVAMPERWAALSPLGVRRGMSTGIATGTPSSPAEDDQLAHEWERRRVEERAEAEREVADADARRHGDAGGLRSDEGSGLLDGQEAQHGKQEEPQR
jgi:Replication-relaxation